MSTITIPKSLANNDDLVVLPRKEYDALLELRKAKEFKPTNGQLKALMRAEKNLNTGKTLSYNDLISKLGFAS